GSGPGQNPQVQPDATRQAQATPGAPEPQAPARVPPAPAIVPPSLLAPLRGAGGAPALADQGGDGNTVGRPPSQPTRQPEVAPIFESPGVLTPKGHVVFEPSVQYGYSSSNRVALVGYTVIPALLIGLPDVREVKNH